MLRIWMSRVHNRNHRSKTKMVPRLQRRKKIFLMEVNKFLLQLLMLPYFWGKHTDCWP
ncbi:hypothetical protein Gogos_012925 [Gossypium gossypioides]|uniref:Uncharacterized protein n=1 Tax=Gossypium gossypioides TaxID=34282 RepID=A0A7J9BU29_GOSGO|nr:hypothetical protein [Gossypium gossypioides]